MKKQTRQQIEPEAFKLYNDGMSLQSIASSCQVTRNTISAWKKKYDWDKREEEITKKTNQKLVNDLSKIRSDMIKISRATLQKYAEQLMRDEIRITASDAANHIRLLNELIEKSKSEENDLNPQKIKFIVEVVDNDNSNSN